MTNARHHLIRVGAFGQVGRFVSVDGVCYPRGARVIVRTSRGLEIGDVLSSPTVDPPAATSDGSILRGMTSADELLEQRLRKNRESAWRACQDRLQQLGSNAVLMDVEHLFDGRALYFYFLGDTGSEIDALTHELAEAYDSEVQFRRFADTLTAGCGPDCGTEHATGQGCATCSSSCAIAAVCGNRNDAHAT